MEETSNEAPEAPEPSLDVMQYVHAVWRRKWLILGVMAVVMLVGLFHTLRQPKIYTANTSLIIDVAAPRVLDTEVKEVMGDERGNYWANKEYYQTQSEVITSRAVSSRVVDRLGLRNDAAFLGVAGIQDEEARKKAMAAADPVAMVRSRITVIPSANSRVVRIAVEDVDPKRAALLANEVADAYIAENLALRLKTTEGASVWLEERMGELGSRAGTSELDLYKFKRGADVLSLSAPGKDGQQQPSTAKLAYDSYMTELIAVRTKMAAVQARVDAMRQLRKSASPDAEHWAEGLSAANEGALRDLRDKVLEQRTQCVELSERYLPEHPKMQECQGKLAVLQQELRRSLENLVKGAETDLAAVKANERTLLERVEQAKAEAFALTEKEIAYQKLRREAENDQRLYEMVLKRFKELELSGQLRTSNVRVLDAALPNPVPVRPNTRSAFMLFFLLGLMGGVAVALGLELLDASVASRADVEERLGLAFIGAMPPLKPDDGGPADLYIHRHPRSQAAEMCRAIRTNLLFMSPDKPFRTVVVSSAGPSEGKSTVVINLGMVMAQTGSRVLLMDTDMRRPRLHRAFGVPDDMGVSSLVVGEGSLEGAIKSTDVPNLFVLPCGPLPPNPAELLHTRAFSELLGKLRERFDCVLLDSPPLGPVSDALVLSKQTDGILLVLKAGTTQREQAKRAIRSLRDVKARVIGALLNHVDLKGGRYGGESYGYGYRGYGNERDEQRSAS
ncbi:GumC family protein [Archangium violaceum]|uniref:non-specific protein-tyrosine kinase n=1 Tax=Archangium violaceum Cb vi76 TaxID=1406225 RepID=A0A084SM94_9BACT|nr:polysaccharide biosynthesis tyrosine autokinase [Archangium violaceum]KFA89579.1 capsular biosynthesis protein [Archangium violaceum Cb vi76]